MPSSERAICSCQGLMARERRAGNVGLLPRMWLLLGLAFAGELSCAPAPTPTPTPTPAVETPVPAPAEPERACKKGERLDSGCVCRTGACFDICCGPNADCAHPAEPGGPSACLLRRKMPAEKRPAGGAAVDSETGKRPACKNGQSLSSGCTCEDTTCIDICCVGTACSHGRGSDNVWPKCMRVGPRGR